MSIQMMNKDAAKAAILADMHEVAIDLLDLRSASINSWTFFKTMDSLFGRIIECNELLWDHCLSLWFFLLDARGI